MQYNWRAVVKEYRKILAEHVFFYKDRTAKLIDLCWKNEFELELFHTDTFHPFDSDGNLSGALERMPAYCNYRSCESYHGYKNGKDRIADALFSMLTESGDIICDHYSNKWNFAPDVKLPTLVVAPDSFVLEISSRMINRILRAAKTV